MNDNTIIENVKKELNRIYKYATNITVKGNERTFYDQAFGVIEFASTMLWSEGHNGASIQVEDLWNDEWEAKFMELLHQGEVKASPIS